MSLKARLVAAFLAAAASGPILAAPPTNANGKGLANRAADVQRGKSLLDRGRGVGRQQLPGDAGGGSVLDRIGSSRGAGGSALGGGGTSTETRGSQRLTTTGARGNALGRARLNTDSTSAIDDGGLLDDPVGEVPTGDPTGELRGRERFALTQAERLLAKRLASIDHLRDVALRNGNTRLLEQCDHLEAIARAQYDRRTAGFDVPTTDPPTDPTAPTDPTSPTDPTAPTDPTLPTDPLDPTLPTDPTDPTLPTDPLDPTFPTDPTDPVDPAPEDPIGGEPLPEDPVEPLPPELPGDTPEAPDTGAGDETTGDVTLGDPIPVDEPAESPPAG
jgi:hypothetical protein